MKLWVPKDCHYWNIIIYKNGKADSLWGSTWQCQKYVLFPKILPNKSCWPLNYVEKVSERTHLLTTHSLVTTGSSCKPELPFSQPTGPVFLPLFHSQYHYQCSQAEGYIPSWRDFLTVCKDRRIFGGMVQHFREIFKHFGYFEVYVGLKGVNHNFGQISINYNFIYNQSK